MHKLDIDNNAIIKSDTLLVYDIAQTRCRQQCNNEICDIVGLQHFKIIEKNKTEIFQIEVSSNLCYRNLKFSDMLKFDIDQLEIKCNLKNRRSEICGREMCLYTVLKMHAI